MFRLSCYIVRDLFYAWRAGRKHPIPPLLAILALTLGIGVSSAVFSIVNAVALQPLPYKDAGRVVMLWNVNEKAGLDLKQLKSMGTSMSVAEFLDWQRDCRSLCSSAFPQRRLPNPWWNGR